MHYFFTAPANWILILLATACLLKNNKWRKRLTIASTLIFLVFSNKALYLLVMKWWQPVPMNVSSKKIETAILLGGIEWMQEGNNGYMRNGADRFIQANKLYHQGVISKILISAGGRDTMHKEATFIKMQLMDAGVAAKDIIVEARSVNTLENAIYSKAIIDSLSLQPPFILITSAYHMPRAKRIFEKAGMAVVPYPCDFENTNRTMSPAVYFWPDVETLDKWGGLIKEWLGIMVYKMQGKI